MLDGGSDVVGAALAAAHAAEMPSEAPRAPKIASGVRPPRNLLPIQLQEFGELGHYMAVLGP